MSSATLSSVFTPARFGDEPVLLLDGGMGTTLQAPPFELALDSALWSSELLATEEGRAQLKKLHSTFIEAGADVVETCTYQSSLPLFLPSTSSSFTEKDLSTSLHTMVSALPVASSCCAPSSASSTSPAAALSLGPFGASLQPGQEYGGLYPAPFSPSDAPETPSKSTCPDAALAAVPLPLDAVAAPGLAPHEQHLAAWHLQRLQHFAQSDAFDSGIKLYAFETVPVLGEATAIRRAVAVFNAERAAAGMESKPFYISFVFPRVKQDTAEETVRFPDPTPAAASLSSLAAQAEAVVSAALSPADGLALPAGLGFNCTSPLHAKAVVEALTAAVQRQQQSSAEKPWLVLYPDGGATYDVVSRSWHHPAGLTDDKWAVLVADAVRAGREAGAWGGVMAGGCCKAGPSAIKALKEEVGRRGWLNGRK
ncbi:hypothetical protein JCM10213_001819 [Rhodosporidiobolus nylandii]